MAEANTGTHEKVEVSRSRLGELHAAYEQNKSVWEDGDLGTTYMSVFRDVAAIKYDAGLNDDERREEMHGLERSLMGSLRSRAESQGQAEAVAKTIVGQVEVVQELAKDADQEVDYFWRNMYDIAHASGDERDKQRADLEQQLRVANFGNEKGSNEEIEEMVRVIGEQMENVETYQEVNVSRRAEDIEVQKKRYTGQGVEIGNGHEADSSGKDASEGDMRDKERERKLKVREQKLVRENGEINSTVVAVTRTQKEVRSFGTRAGQAERNYGELDEQVVRNTDGVNEVLYGEEAVTDAEAQRKVYEANAKVTQARSLLEESRGLLDQVREIDFGAVMEPLGSENDELEEAVVALEALFIDHLEDGEYDEAERLVARVEEKNGSVRNLVNEANDKLEDGNNWLGGAESKLERVENLSREAGQNITEASQMDRNTRRRRQQEGERERENRERREREERERREREREEEANRIFDSEEHRVFSPLDRETKTYFDKVGFTRTREALKGIERGSYDHYVYRVRQELSRLEKNLRYSENDWDPYSRFGSGSLNTVIERFAAEFPDDAEGLKNLEQEIKAREGLHREFLLYMQLPRADDIGYIQGNFGERSNAFFPNENIQDLFDAQGRHKEQEKGLGLAVGYAYDVLWRKVGNNESVGGEVLPNIFAEKLSVSDRGRTFTKLVEVLKERMGVDEFTAQQAVELGKRFTVAMGDADWYDATGEEEVKEDTFTMTGGIFKYIDDHNMFDERYYDVVSKEPLQVRFKMKFRRLVSGEQEATSSVVSRLMNSQGYRVQRFFGNETGELGGGMFVTPGFMECVPDMYVLPLPDMIEVTDPDTRNDISLRKLIDKRGVANVRWNKLDMKGGEEGIANVCDQQHYFIQKAAAAYQALTTYQVKEAANPATSDRLKVKILNKFMGKSVVAANLYGLSPDHRIDDAVARLERAHGRDLSRFLARYRSTIHENWFWNAYHQAQNVAAEGARLDVKELQAIASNMIREGYMTDAENNRVVREEKNPGIFKMMQDWVGMETKEMRFMSFDDVEKVTTVTPYLPVR